MEPMTVAWWMWLLAGIALLVVEMLTPGGFFTLFFGAGALVVGLLGLLGWQPGIPVQGLLFLAVSVASLLFFRKPLMERFQKSIPNKQVDSLVGETAVAHEDIPAGGRAKADALPHPPRPTAPRGVLGNDLRGVAHRRPPPHQPPHQIDILAVAQNGIEPADGVERLPPGEQDRGRDVGDAAARCDPGRDRTQIERGLRLLVAITG